MEDFRATPCTQHAQVLVLSINAERLVVTVVAILRGGVYETSAPWKNIGKQYDPREIATEHDFLQNN